MFKRKDIIRSMLLLLLIFTIMVTLSQILVVHQHNHHNVKQRDVPRLKKMLRELERNIDLMLKRDALPLDKYEKTIQAIIYSRRVATIVERWGSNTEISGTYYRHEIVHDEIHDTRNERKSRVLHNIDIINPSDEAKEPMKMNFKQLSSMRMTRSGEKTFLTMKHPVQVNTEKIKADTAINLDSKCKASSNDYRNASTKTNLKSNLKKRNSWSSYRGTILKKEESIGSKCPEIPEGLGKFQLLY